MEFAHARRPREDHEVVREAPRALRAVPEDLTPAERRDWQNLAERRDRRERAERTEASRHRRAVRPADPTPRREGAPARTAGPGPRRAPTAERLAEATLRPEGIASGRAAEGAASARNDAAMAQPLPPARRVAAPATAPRRGTAPRRTVQASTPPAPARARQPRRMPRMAGIGAGPDRLALWAVVLCLFMALVAAATARGDEPAAEPGPAGAAPAAEAAQPAVQPRR